MRRFVAVASGFEGAFSHPTLGVDLVFFGTRGNATVGGHGVLGSADAMMRTLQSGTCRIIPDQVAATETQELQDATIRTNNK